MNFCYRVTPFIFLILTLKSRNLLPFLGWNSKWSHFKPYKRLKMSLYPLEMVPTLMSIIRFSSYYDYSLCYGKYIFESIVNKLCCPNCSVHTEIQSVQYYYYWIHLPLTKNSKISSLNSSLKITIKFVYFRDFCKFRVYFRGFFVNFEFLVKGRWSHY